MNASVRSSVFAITLVLVGLSQPGWEAAHAVTHGEEAEDHGHHHGDVPQPPSDGTDSVESAAVEVHGHPNLGAALVKKNSLNPAQPASVKLFSDIVLPGEIVLGHVFQDPVLPRAGPLESLSTRSRAPPIV